MDGVLQDSVDDLRKAFAKAKPAMYVARQRFTLPLAEGEKKATVLGSGKKLSDYGLTEGSKVVFKDLGPQVRYSLSIRCLCARSGLKQRGPEVVSNFHKMNVIAVAEHVC